MRGLQGAPFLRRS